MINSRTKGIAFERKIARDLRPFFPEAKRGLQYQAGVHCPDVVGTPFYIECKRGKTKLSVTTNKTKRQINPYKKSELLFLFNIYAEKKDQWLKEDLKMPHEEWLNNYTPVMLIWKLDRKPIQVTIDGLSCALFSMLESAFDIGKLKTISFDSLLRKLKSYPLKPFSK